MPESPAIRRISIVAPMWNEGEHVESLVDDLAAQDFDGDLEIFVADGGSTDGAVERLRRAADRRELSVTIFDNPARWVSHGLNRCIRAASGDLIVRIDCHSRYPADYVRLCALAAEETEADNVGGILIPVGRTPMERAVGCAMDSPFGGVHWTRHGSSDRVDVDTVPYGAFRPEVFRRVGLFDESLVRNQDDEFNLRLRRAGGRVVLDPAIRTYYTPRSSFRRVFRQYYQYGLWKVAVMRKHRRVVSARSLVPIAFLLSLGVLAALTPWFQTAFGLLVLELATYAVGAGTAAALSVRRAGESWRLLPLLIAIFPTVHLAFGAGMLAGWTRAGLRFLGAAPLAASSPGEGAP
jgi:GT2 family glycosyltransferase